MFGFIKGVFVQAAAFALASAFVVACSDGDKTAGGTTEDAGIIADLNVAGVTQKGPFAKGSSVTVQGIDCQTMELTDEKFSGSVKSDKGDFEIKDVNLSSTCAAFEVKGYYFNEVTGKKSSDKLTLHALTDLKDRKNVNINLLTELEYERVMNLVTEEKMEFAEAKKKAEKEVLAAFSVKAKDGEFALSEDLNILEKGDDNAALLAVSVMMQSDLKVAKLAERVNDVAADIAKDGSWDDDKTKTEIAEWAATADKNGEFTNVGKNIEKWGGSDEVSAFETVVEMFAENVITDAVSNSSSVILSSGSREGSSSSKVPEPVEGSSSSKNVLSSSSSSVIASETKQSSSSRHSGIDPESSSGAVDSYLNPNIDYGEMIDSRDGQVYKTVKIGNQVWMAQNLNYETKNSYCYNDSTTYCEKYGRLYTWAAAMDSVKTKCGNGLICSPAYPVQGICPDGWHLPDTSEWRSLISAVGGSSVAGKILKSQLGWKADTDKGSGNGTDDFGFSALSAGVGYYEGYYNFEGISAFFWSSTENDSIYTYGVRLDYVGNGATLYYYGKDDRFSVRCLKDGSETVPASSSSSVIPTSSGDLPSSSSETLATPCKTKTEDNCEYGEIVDERDGQTYKTVKIGEQVWMAENLNYAYTSIPFKYKEDASDSTSWCYNNDASNCKKYGRLYTWAMAMDSSATWSDNGKNCGYGVSYSPTYPVQGICLSGWHLPSEDEWRALLTAVGGWSTAGKVLKSQYEWNEEGNGTDEFGFTALPAGFRDDTGKFIGEGEDAFFGVPRLVLTTLHLNTQTA